MICYWLWSYSKDVWIIEIQFCFMSVESCTHKSLYLVLKVHQIDAFNFNI